MAFVLTLICDPAHPAVDTGAVAAALEALRSQGVAASEPRWLADAIACDIPFRAPAASGLEDAARARLADRPVDVAVQPSEGRRRRMLVADIESTMIANEMLDEIAALADSDGTLGRQVADLTARAMRGELDFREALRARVRLLRGRPAALLERARERIMFTPGAAALVATMRKHGAFTALVTGGFEPFTQWVRERLGCDVAIGNRLGIENGVLTGAVAEPIVDRDGKRAALTALAAERDIPLADVMAVGDGANDVPMVQAAGAGVAFRAKKILADAARFRVAHGDLTALLYLQGYTEREIVG
ncbi:MAG: phosphoserine phosphatase SerB [Alphaproteobacteria bacterium]